MASLAENATIAEYQKFVKDLYGISNDRHFTTSDMLANVERFLMRGLKGIRKGDREKTKFNIMISLSWSISFMNQMHVDVEEETWKRFPYLCSYCGSCPCVCKENKIEKRRSVSADESRRPKTLADFQKMFEEIYPSSKRTLEHAGIHLAEEMGELSETILSYRSVRSNVDFDNVKAEAADLMSCFFGVLNSMKLNAAKEIAFHFSNNCHECHKMPCECSFEKILTYKS
ncbi:MAG: MazG-like family protein [Candidatus Liptonbacteria bacterium]|nr:MazG-like family protein [Candidatus Liptonbacteria bacterium]